VPDGRQCCRRDRRRKSRLRHNGGTADPGIVAHGTYRRRQNGRVNVRWHEEHRLPRDAPPEERVAWHVAHAEACGCRPIPASVAREIAARDEPRR
jgi:hypothetical protein